MYNVLPTLITQVGPTYIVTHQFHANIPKHFIHLKLLHSHTRVKGYTYNIILLYFIIYKQQWPSIKIIISKQNKLPYWIPKLIINYALLVSVEEKSLFIFSLQVIF